MAIKPNNWGQEMKKTWGVLGKRKTYVNEAFETIEIEEQQKRYNWEAKLKPWSAMDKGHLTVMMPAPTTTTTTTTPVSLVEWQNNTTEWQLEGDNWENVT